MARIQTGRSAALCCRGWAKARRLCSRRARRASRPSASTRRDRALVCDKHETSARSARSYDGAARTRRPRDAAQPADETTRAQIEALIEPIRVSAPKWDGAAGVETCRSATPRSTAARSIAEGAVACTTTRRARRSVGDFVDRLECDDEDEVTAMLVDGGRRYRVALAEQRDRPGSTTGRITLTVVAEDERTSAVLWRWPIRELWGAYGLADCARLGFAVDHLSLSAIAGSSALVVHTPDGSWYLADAATGLPIAELLWEHLDRVPALPHALALVSTARIPIQAMPGHGYQLKVRNDGPVLALAPHYRHLRLEVLGPDAGWRSVAEDRVAETALCLVGPGELVEIFVSAASAALLDNHAAARLVFLVHGLDGDGRPTIPLRAAVSVRP